MWRFLIVSVLVLVGGNVFGQDWVYASVQRDRQTGLVKRFKLVSASDTYPFYVRPINLDNPLVDVYDWVSEASGTLKAVRSDSLGIDSAILIEGQRTWIARKTDTAWQIGESGVRLTLQQIDGALCWVLEKTISPVAGSQVMPEPIPLLFVLPHKWRRRFDIELAGQLESIPDPILQLGIVIALVIEGFPEEE